ncbi:TonB-dependent siderophore receptor [Pseudomonas taeanensis]|uniref:TonB-dependent siderophore receptor n=1 Tax=Pseudomonas taeanensis TaxID=574962 RepID=UPI0009F9A0DE
MLCYYINSLERISVLRPALALATSLLAPGALADTPVQLTDSVITAPTEVADGPVQGYRATRSSSATKTDTPLSEIPQAISVVPAAVLEDLGSSDVERALDFAGGIAKQNDFGGLTLYEYSVRGFTTSEFYKDGFSANRGYPSTPDAANIERIEVLKGPAASLYGRGDPGGTVNIITKKPQAGTFARLQTSAGSWNRYRSSLDLNSPLDDQGDLLARLNLAVEDNNSFREHMTSERLFAAPSLSWQLSPDTRVLWEAELVRHRSVFDRGIVAPNNRLGSVSRSTFLGEPSDGTIDNDNNLIQASLEHALNDSWQLRLASHFKEGELAGNASENQALAGDGRTLTRRFRERETTWHDSITQLELRGDVQFVGLQHQLLIGSEYEDYRKNERVTEVRPRSAIDIYDPIYGRPRPTGARSGSDNHEQVESHALNLQDQVVFTERLRGLIGVRFEHFDQSIDNQVNGARSNQSHDALTQRTGLLYQLTPAVGLFANASTSFKPNNGLDRSDRPFDPEQGIGYEAGLKLDLLDNRLSATLAAFHLTKENVLTADPVDASFQTAAGEARSQGFDLQLSGQLSDALRVIGAFAFIDAEVIKGDEALPAGSRLLGVARQSGSLLGVYEFQDGWLRGSDLGAAVTYVGDRSGQTGSDFNLPAYHTLDLLAHYAFSPRVKVGTHLNNLLDEQYYERSYSNLWVMPGEPRNLSFNLTVDL